MLNMNPDQGVQDLKDIVVLSLWGKRLKDCCKHVPQSVLIIWKSIRPIPSW